LPFNVTSLQIMSSPQRNEAMRPWLLLTALLLLFTAFMGILKLRNQPDRENQIGSEWLLSGVFGIFMTLSCSKALHYLLPGATDVQFPFRWLLPASAVLAPLMAAGVVKDESCRSFANRIISHLAGAGMLFLLSAGMLLQLLFWPLPQNSIDEFFANPGHLQPFYPRAVPDLKKLPLHAGMPHQLALISGEAELSDYQSGITSMHCTFNSSAPVELNILTHYDKYWHLSASSKAVPLKPSSENGTILAIIPAGSWKLELSRQAPDGRNTGWLLMLGTLLLMLRQYRGETDRIRH